MKKIRLLLTFILIISVCTALLCCARGEKLDTPSGVRINPDNLILEWGEVSGARMYTVRIEREGSPDELVQRSTPGYSLESLGAGEYTVSVKAVGKERVSRDSDYSQKITFVRESESGLILALTKDGGEYTVISKGEATGNVIIPDTYRTKPVTEIGDTAFFNKSDLTGIVFGKNIKRVGNMAFANCSYLTSVTLSDSLVSIGEGAFSSCRTLGGEITIPEGVCEIPQSAFAHCGAITGVNFGTKTKTIGVSAFTNCDSLTAITLPDSVEKIDAQAFALCSSLSEISFGKGLTEIGDYALSSLPATTLTLPDSLEKIGTGAFLNCRSLSAVTFGESVYSIGAGAFSDTAIWGECESNEVYLCGWFLGLKDTSAQYVDFRPDTVGIASGALLGNKKLNDIILPDSTKYIGERAFATSKVINMVIGAGVKVIGKEAFAGCTSLSNLSLGSYDFNNAVMIASSLEVIENNAFFGCEGLDTVNIPKSVTKIGSYAFRKSGIEKTADGGLIYAGRWLVGFTDDFGGFAQIRSGTVGISDYAFYECNALLEVSMPSSVEHLGRAAFYNCKNLSAVRLSSSVEIIDDYTFYGCERYKITNLPDSLTYIGKSAFYSCGSSLSSLEGAENESNTDTLIIPEGVEYIGDYAFFGCGEAIPSDNGEIFYFGIDKIVIADGVKKIGDCAFHSFASLKEISVGAGVDTVGNKAFYGCERLDSISFGKGIKSIGDRAFYKCVSLKSLTLPDSLEYIGDYAFYKCISLASPVNSASLKHIGNYAFADCTSISEIGFSHSLDFIGNEAFRGCKEIKSVILHSGIEYIGPHVFYGCTGMTIYSDLTECAAGWDTNFNSSFRPIVWGVSLSEELDYVISFTMTDKTLENKNVTNTLSAPVREGYDFVGWDTNPSAEMPTYPIEKTENVPSGRKVFAVWAEITQE